MIDAEKFQTVNMVPGARTGVHRRSRSRLLALVAWSCLALAGSLEAAEPLLKIPI